MEAAMEDKILKGLLANGPKTVGELSVLIDVSATPLLRCLQYMHQKKMVVCDRDISAGKVYWRHPNSAPKAGAQIVAGTLPVTVKPTSALPDPPAIKRPEFAEPNEPVKEKESVMLEENKLRPVVPNPEETHYEAACRLYGVNSPEATAEFLSLDGRSTEGKKAQAHRRKLQGQKIVVRPFIPAQEELSFSIFQDEYVMITDYSDGGEKGSPAQVMIPYSYIDAAIEALSKLKKTMKS